ncbi:MAG: TonB-dependent receptor plug domain-containing protein, partial [Bacteroidota bacterium]
MKNSGIVFICLITAACASSKKSNPTLEVLQVPTPNEVTPAMANLQLSEYLKRIPGIQVSGAVSDPQISIRGINTFGAGNEPLYVLDGVVIGNS